MKNTTRKRNSAVAGMNRTGLASARQQAKAMLYSSYDESAPVAPGTSLSEVRVEYARVSEPVGTVPPASSLNGVAPPPKAVSGNKASVLIDKLAERLAFERTGTRLYQALIAKAEVGRGDDGGPTRAELEEIRSDELEHFHLVHRAIERIGADPTAQTPSADLAGVASGGLLQIVCDPRTTLREGLQAILHAELADNAGWVLLIDLAESFGHREMAADFEQALRTEDRHLERVRAWLTRMVQHQAFGEAASKETPEPANA